MLRGATHDLLAAHAESFPLTAPAAYESATIALSRRKGATGRLSDETERLGRALEERLRPLAGGQSLAALLQVRDAAWFGAPEPGAGPAEDIVSLDCHLGRLARRYLACEGSHPVLLTSDGIASRAARFRWLTLLLPADLLVSALTAGGAADPPFDTPLLATPQVQKVLERPTADTHLHLGAALSFSTVWTGLMTTLGSMTPGEEALGRAGPPPFGSAPRFLRALLSAAMIRTWLGAFLWQRSLSGGELDAFLAGHLPDVAARLEWAPGEAAARDAMSGVLGAVTAGSLPEIAPYALAKMYRKLVGPRRAPPGMDELAAADPLADWLSPAQGTSLPETRFARRALAYLGGPGARDSLFARCFWQYERIRCLTFRHLTQDPGPAGLDWFARHYQRISALRAGIAGLLPASALSLQAEQVNLASIEVRTAPAPSWAEIRADVRTIARHALAHRRGSDGRPEIGLILHFIKEAVSSQTKKLHGDPQDPSFGCRYGRWYAQREREAMAVAQLLSHRPESLSVLRGVDVANSEQAIPLWPTLPLIAAARAASARASEALHGRGMGDASTPFRVTYHAGEDYCRLASGLRRVHELVDFGALRAGDRIGHALALGDVPARWAERCDRVVQSREERLEDLLWELSLYGHGDLLAEAGRSALLQEEASRLVREIYGPLGEGAFLDLRLQAAARRARHDPAELQRLGYPRMMGATGSGLGPSRALLVAQLTDAGVFRRGLEPVEVSVTPGEIAFLKAAQRCLRAVLGRLEVTVESNPSSNLLIGSYGDVTEHPAFRLQPLPGMSAPDGDPVLLSVNVDDPITFASRLADEYAHLYYGLLRQNVTSQDALLWLDRVRENGYRSRFTLPSSRDGAVLRAIVSRYRV